MIDFTIASIIASMRFRIRIDLSELDDIIGVNNYSGQPHFIAFRFPGISVTVIVYESGTITFAGAKSFDELGEAKRMIQEYLKQIKINPEPEPKLQVGNIVAVADFGSEIDIEELSKQKHPPMVYLPEQFPGLIIRNPKSSLVVLAFHTGKVVVTGAKSVKDIRNGFRGFVDLVERVLD